MRQRMEARLEELKREFTTGQERLRELQEQQALLQQTLLRISGAAQVLEELLAQGEDAGPAEPAGASEQGSRLDGAEEVLVGRST